MEFWPEFLAGSWGKEFLAGALGGMAGVVAGHPLDTVRIRLQQPRSLASTEPVSAFAMMRKIASSEGPLALFKGMGPPLATVAFQNAVAFQTYALLKRALSEPGSDDPLPYSKIALAGSCAGTIQTLILTPVDLIKIRLQLETARLAGTRPSLATFRQREIGPRSLASKIVKAEGVRGLYRGLTITALRDAPSHAVYFVTYEYVREQLSPGCRKNGQESVMTMLTAGGLAGVVSWVCCYPLDVVKSRLQAQSPTKPRYAGITDCMRKSIREEGYSVLFRGLGAAVARAYIVNGAIFSAYELALRLLSAPPQTTNSTGPQQALQD